MATREQKEAGRRPEKDKVSLEGTVGFYEMLVRDLGQDCAAVLPTDAVVSIG
jgi:hypothetical protein